MALTEAQLEEVREVFEHYDSDSNGVIDHGEFRAVLKTLDPAFPESEIATGLAALDENGNGVIDWEEFLDWWGDRFR